MQRKQLLFLTTLLIVYIGRVLFGEALHLAACCSGHSKSSRNEHVSSCSAAHHHPCDNLLNEQSTESDPSRQDHQHDSANCYICQELGQAQDQAVTIDISASCESIPLFSDSPSALYLAITRDGVQERAPPSVA